MGARRGSLDLSRNFTVTSRMGGERRRDGAHMNVYFTQISSSP